MVSKSVNSTVPYWHILTYQGGLNGAYHVCGSILQNHKSAMEIPNLKIDCLIDTSKMVTKP